MTAAELIAFLQQVPPDSLVAMRHPADGLIHHVSARRTVGPDEWGVVVLAPSDYAVTEEDVS